MDCGEQCRLVRHIFIIFFCKKFEGEKQRCRFAAERVWGKDQGEAFSSQKKRPRQNGKTNLSSVVRVV
jgi:hypothetical protein